MVYRRGYRAFTTHQIIVTKKKREIDKIGYTRVVSEQNRVPFFSRRGALTHVCKTPSKSVLAPEPTTPCVRAATQTVFRCSTPQNSANDGAQKCSPRTTRFCSGTHRVYPAPCFDFINHPILFILPPILFIPQPSTEDLSPKIFHTTGKLPTVTTVMQPQQHKDPP